jgi:hypothetical protein
MGRFTSGSRINNQALLNILNAFDPALAALTADDRDAILAALQQYLDPDGDGQMTMLHWDTLEERGRIGFYIERG